MINNTEKTIFGGVVGFHLVILLSMALLMTDGVLFGRRYFNEIIFMFRVFEIVIFSASFVFIYNNSRAGYVFLGIALVSSWIIFMGHWLGIYECPYCDL